MIRRSTAWSEEEDHELWRLHCLGISETRLSVRLRRSRRAIKVRIYALRRKFQTAAPETMLSRTRDALIE
jgi:hypothetical protein